MSLKLQQTAGNGGSSSGRRIGPASKTNRPPVTNEVIDVDSLDDLPLSQTINQKSTNNQSNDSKSDNKKSLIPIATNEKNNQVTSTTTMTPVTPGNELKNIKETNLSTKSVSDKKDNNKNIEKNGHNIEQIKSPVASQKEPKSTNGHKNEDINKKLNQSSTNGNDEKKESITRDDKMKINSDEQNTNVIATDSEKSGLKLKKNSSDKKKSIDEIISNVDVQSQSTVITQPKRTSQRAAAIQANASLASLANEKEFKGFTDIGDDEIESLILQIDTAEEIEKLNTITPTKLTSNTEKKNERENKKSAEKKKDEMQIPPLSTEQYKSPAKMKISTVPFTQSPITSTPDVKQQHSYLPRPTSTSIRSISGRRSLRPMNEYSFQTSYRESYRKIHTEFDTTGNTSLNVTVGSDTTQSDQLTSMSSSFSFFGRGKKREHQSLQKSPEHCQLINDVDNELDTSVSKRARLDLSGILGIVASPVTMLRARLSRAKIQSTPKTKSYDNVDENVENFSGIISGDNKNNEILQDNKINNDDENVEIEDDISLKIDDDDEKLKNIKDISDATVATEDDEIIVTEIENSRRMCSLM